MKGANSFDDSEMVSSESMNWFEVMSLLTSESELPISLKEVNLLISVDDLTFLNLMNLFFEKVMSRDSMIIFLSR